LYYIDKYAHSEDYLDYTSPDLLLKAQKTAEREDRTISELFREALPATLPPIRSGRRCCAGHARPARRWASPRGDVERLSDEFRQERLQTAAH